MVWFCNKTFRRMRSEWSLQRSKRTALRRCRIGLRAIGSGVMMHNGNVEPLYYPVTHNVTG